MPPIKKESKKRTWSEINKQRKEDRKKWKEEKIKKKKHKTENKIEQTNDTNKAKELSTISIAIPGSILENAQSFELRTYLAGQIARTACLFQIDEVIVFDDYGDEVNAKKSELEDNYGFKTARQSCVQLARILQYLECPQYLRKHFFPLHKDLQFSGLLNPLNAPHHLSQKDIFLYREGIVTTKPTQPGKGSIVNVGLLKDVHIDKLLTPGLRCTVKLTTDQNTSKKLKGIVVSPEEPRIETGIFWGYQIRIANSLSEIFSQSPWKEGYDVIIGTSDKGTSVDEFECPSFKHMLIIFGGVKGLEFALENDSVLQVDDPKLLCDAYLNTLPGQGSKTIRTEEAVLITLSALRPKLNPKNKNLEFLSSNEQFNESQINDTGLSDDMSRFD